MIVFLQLNIMTLMTDFNLQYLFFSCGQSLNIISMEDKFSLILILSLQK